jgi:hypothetical protein
MFDEDYIKIYHERVFNAIANCSSLHAVRKMFVK